MSKNSKLLNAFQRGEELTSKQIEARFDVSSGRSLVHSLREQGFPIYLNKRVNVKGQITNKYRLGTPTRSVIAAGFKAMRSAEMQAA
jgi:hypothetical protein